MPHVARQSYRSNSIETVCIRLVLSHYAAPTPCKLTGLLMPRLAEPNLVNETTDYL